MKKHALTLIVGFGLLATLFAAPSEVPYSDYLPHFGDTDIILEGKMLKIQSQPTNAAAVTPNDGANLPTPARRLFIGGAGTLKVDMTVSGTVTFNGLVAGQVLDVQCKKVYATGTTATNIIALW